MQSKRLAALPTTLAALFLASGMPAQAETMRPGGKEVADCEACHGPKGCAPLNGLIPKLCGQNEEYLVMTLVQFRDGARISPIMHMTSKDLSDELIQQLSAYFAHGYAEDN